MMEKIKKYYQPLIFLSLIILFLLLGIFYKKNSSPIITPSSGPTKQAPPIPKEYNPQGDQIIVEDPRFHITYYPKFKQYSISVLGSPFEENRQIAENELIKQTGFDKDTLCTMGIDITTPLFANPNEAGKIYPLSFCLKPSPSPTNR
jgi:hypothetical protein